MREPVTRHSEARGSLGEYIGTLDAVLIRGDGSHRDLGTISKPEHFRFIGRPIQWWRSLWAKLRQNKIIPITMGFAIFLSTYGVVEHMDKLIQLTSDQRVADIIMGYIKDNPRDALGILMGLPVAGLVVTQGANFLASDMASGQASPRISAMNFHDSGTGTVAATSTDAGLGTQAGPATRATGVQSNPATNSYRTVGTIAYTTGLAITEWGLFSASTVGTMWDRRVFGVINVVNLDSIQYTYTLTISAGGS